MFTPFRWFIRNLLKNDWLFVIGPSWNQKKSSSMYQISTIATVIFWWRSRCWDLSIRAAGAKGRSFFAESVFSTLLTTILCHVVSGCALCWNICHNCWTSTAKCGHTLTREIIIPAIRSQNLLIRPIVKWFINRNTNPSTVFHPADLLTLKPYKVIWELH